MNRGLIAAGVLLFAAVAQGFARGLGKAHGRRQDLARSFAGGVGLAFVTLQLFVELVEAARHEAHAILRAGPEPVHTVAVLLLVGTAAFLAATTYVGRRAEGWRTYAVALAPRVVYGGLVGAAMVHESAEGLISYAAFVLGTALHVAVSERHLARDFPREHGAWAQVAVFGSPMGGALVWAALHPRIELFFLLLALIAGTTLLGVLRDELPAPRDVHFGALGAGLAAFGVLMELRWWVDWAR